MLTLTAAGLVDVDAGKIVRPGVLRIEDDRIVGVGGDAEGKRLLASFPRGVEKNDVVRARGYRTPVKTRILAGGVHAARQQVVRIDRETGWPLDESVSIALAKKIAPALETCDAVILSDYGSGLVTPALGDTIRRQLARKKNVVEKKMFGGVGLLNGKMLVGVWKHWMIVRLGPEASGDALREPHVKEFDITGRAMTGWVMVEPAGLEDDDQLAEWIQRAFQFVRKLTAK